MKIKVKETTVTENEIEISLPAFRKEKSKYNTSFIKVINEKEYISTDSSEQCFGLNYYTLSTDKFFTNEYEDCTEHEFNEKAAQCIARATELLPFLMEEKIS